MNCKDNKAFRGYFNYKIGLKYYMEWVELPFLYKHNK